MPTWEKRQDDGTVRECVQMLKRMDSHGYRKMTAAALRDVVDTKRTRISFCQDGDNSLCQVWTWNDKRQMWRLLHIGFDNGWAPVQAMRAHARQMRAQMATLGVTRVYAVADYPTQSARLNAFIDAMEAQMWECEIDRQLPGGKVYIYDRSDPGSAPPDEAWRRRPSRAPAPIG